VELDRNIFARKSASGAAFKNTTLFFSKKIWKERFIPPIFAARLGKKGVEKTRKKRVLKADKFIA
jgi:hypothetical protein